MADVPTNLRYTEEHEWVRLEGETATVGITDFAQEALGEVTYVELPAPGATLTRGEEFAVVESLKAASDVYAPLSGTVAAVNEALEDDPRQVNAEPYGAGWLCTVEGIDPAEVEGLLSPEQYQDLIEST
jgi:glycine cleavage system H protein